MLGKIWGLTLLLLAAYIGYEVLNENFEAPKIPLIKKESQLAARPSLPNEKDESASESEKIQKVEESNKKSKEELLLDINSVCKEMETEMKKAKISPYFRETSIKFYEDLAENQFLTESLKNCFQSSSRSNLMLEIEIFSSEFAGESADQLQIQASLYDLNKASLSEIDGDSERYDKVFEVGRKLETQKKIPSLSTRDQK